MWYEKFIDRGLIPDYFLRLAIKIQILNRLKIVNNLNVNINDLFAKGDISSHSKNANKQHYEVPIQFFELILGKHMKYSAGLINSENDSLNLMEVQMLELVSERALIENNQKILELGCGWGSSTLYYAQRFTDSHFTAVTNSDLQKSYIEQKISTLGLNNIQIVKSDINDFSTNQKFDRVFSIEMFEHMKNWSKLLENTYKWLNSTGKLFVHYFCHKNKYYRFSENSNSWMEKYFFSGGSMPNLDIFQILDNPFQIEKVWKVSGINYHKTLEFWYANLKANKNDILKIDFYDDLKQEIHFNRWKVFIIACSELFKLNHGEEFIVGHALLSK
mgnify:CR=1 FL=1